MFPAITSAPTEQYRVVFQAAAGYRASHSAVITVTVVAPTS
jgi:hypothetical protein